MAAQAPQAQAAVLDLNEATTSQLETLHGIGPVKAQAIVRYRNQHGRFNHPTELLQVPGIGQRTYAGLCRQVAVDGVAGCDESGHVDAPTEVSMPSLSDDGRLDVNLASAAELEVLPRIGPALAARIVTYRESHGLFQSVDALDDVPGIGPATLEDLRPFVTTQININTATVNALEQLGVTDDVADAIVRQRAHGYYQSVDDLAHVPGVDAASVEALRPYVYAEEPLDAE